MRRSIATSAGWRRWVTVSLCSAVVLSMLAPWVAGPAVAAGETSVEIEPADASVAADGAVGVDVVVTSADGGVGAVEFELAVDDPGTAAVVDVELHGDPQLEETSVASDGSVAHVEAALMDTDDSGRVAIATVTVRGASEGDAELDLAVGALGDEDGHDYAITGTGDATVTVEGEPSTDGSSGGTATNPPATDAPASSEGALESPTASGEEGDGDGTGSGGTATDGAEDTPTPSGGTVTVDSPGQSGFGLVVAAVALSMTVLFTRRS